MHIFHMNDGNVFLFFFFHVMFKNWYRSIINLFLNNNFNEHLDTFREVFIMVLLNHVIHMMLLNLYYTLQMHHQQLLLNNS